MSIRTLLLLLVLAVWIPAAIGFSLLARTTYLREAGDAREDVARLGHSLNQLIERELDNRAAIARTLGASWALHDGELRKFHAEAAATTQGSGNWVVLLDAQQHLVNTRQPFEAHARSPRASTSPFVVDAQHASTALITHTAQEPVLAVLAPDLHHQPPRYNVAVAFTTDTMQKVIDQDLSFDALVSVLNESQTIVGRNREPKPWIGQRPGPDIQRRAREAGDSFSESVTLDGVPSLTYVSSANRYGWNVVLALPKTHLSDVARRLTTQALAASAFLLAIGLGMAVVVARFIGKPIVELRHAAHLLGQDAVPRALHSRVLEANEVSRTLEAAGRRAQEATRTLELKVARAVDDARRAQAALHEGQKLEAIGRLTGGLAHDFNNLLQTITTALHVLNRDAPADSPLRRYTAAAMRASAKAAELVKQMMSFGRAQPLNPRPVDLRQLVLHGQELTRKAVGKRIHLKAEIDPGLPPVFADPVPLELALLNLCFNARDAMPQGGTITLSARRASAPETAGLDAGDYVLLEVADDGPGMSDEVRAQAFEPYVTTKPVGAGWGLGLSQVMSFACQSRGTATLHSTPGQGTRVQIILPASTVPIAATDTSPHTPASPTRRLQVLMVEDDTLVSSVVVPVLREAGHDVTLCESADAALVQLKMQDDFDVLLTDVVVPGQLTGLDVAQWSQAHKPHVAVVVATGYSHQPPGEGLIELRKPYALDDLLSALQRSVDQKRPR